MGRVQYSKLHVMLGSASAATRSAPVFIGDFRQMSLSIESSTASASRYTFQGSNAEGFQAAIREAEWSSLTVITTQGLQTVDPGLRWLRCDRDDISVSAASNTTISLNGSSV